MSEAIDKLFGIDIEEEWKVRDDSAAEWCLKKIKEAQETVEKWKAHYAAQMERVMAEADRTIAYFTAKLEEYFDSVPRKATKTQESYALPGGRLIRKHQQPKFTVDDETALPWLAENKLWDMIETKQSVRWGDLKKTVTVTPDGAHVATADGEIVPGISVEQRPDVFKVEVGE